MLVLLSTRGVALFFCVADRLWSPAVILCFAGLCCLSLQSFYGFVLRSVKIFVRREISMLTALERVDKKTRQSMMKTQLDVAQQAHGQLKTFLDEMDCVMTALKAVREASVPTKTPGGPYVPPKFNQCEAVYRSLYVSMYATFEGYLQNRLDDFTTSRIKTLVSVTGVEAWQMLSHTMKLSVGSHLSKHADAVSVTGQADIASFDKQKVALLINNSKSIAEAASFKNIIKSTVSHHIAKDIHHLTPLLEVCVRCVVVFALLRLRYYSAAW